MKRKDTGSLIPTLVFLGVCTIVLFLAAKSYSQSMMVGIPQVLSSRATMYAVYETENFSTGERTHSVLRLNQPVQGKGYELTITESDFSTYAEMTYKGMGKEVETARIVVGKPQLFDSLKFTITGFTSAEK